MILLKRIQLNNFLSHKDTVVEIGGSRKLLLDGASGSGKSSIPEALIWALYGVGRSDSRGLIMHGKDSCSVVVELYDGDTSYIVDRGLTDKGKHRLSVKKAVGGARPTLIETTGLKGTQEWIEKDLLGASYLLFVNSVAYLQENTQSFVRQTAAKRKDLLLEILGSISFDELVVSSRNAFSTCSGNIMTIESRLSEKTRLIDQILIPKAAGLAKANDEHKATLFLINDYKARLEAVRKLTEARNDAFTRVTSFSKEINRLSDSLAALKALVIADQRNAMVDTTIDTVSIQKKIANRKVLQDEYDVIYSAMATDSENNMKRMAHMSNKPIARDYDAEIEELNKRLIRLSKGTPTCPSGDACPFAKQLKPEIAYTENQLNEKIVAKKAYEETLTKYTKELELIPPSFVTQENKDRFNKVREELNELTSLEAKLALLSTQVERARVLADVIARNKAQIEKETVELDVAIIGREKANAEYTAIRIETSAIEIEQNINTLNDALFRLSVDIKAAENAEVEIAATKKEIEEEKKKLGKENADLADIVAIKDALGNNGLKAVAADYIIPRFEDKINEVLAQISDFRVRLETQRGNLSNDGVTEGLFINIYNESGASFDFDNYSGGERLKITVAISEALASLQKAGFRILDELFIGLDETSIEGFATVMSRLQQRFPQILCISHLRSIKDMFDDIISVTKQDGVSKIKTNVQ